MGIYNCSLLGYGYYVPETILTNAQLETMMDTSDEWIVSRTGIKERRIAAREQTASDLGALAARKAIAAAGIQAADLDLIITATITGDYIWPATACRIQDKLGLHGIPAFDISAACTGFIYGLNMARGLIASGSYKNILLVCTEKFSAGLNWQDRNVSVLFADGAGAVVLGRSADEGVLASALFADGSKSDLLLQPGGGSCKPISAELVASGQHYLQMNGKEVYMHAVSKMPQALDAVLSQAGLAVEQLDHLVFHQANLRIIQAIVQRYRLPADKVVVNLDRYGNTSAATIPIALAESLESRRIKRGDLVGVAAFGGGFTWGAAIIRI
ncbi:MAG: ketoacyl-ACP synthase III [Spirochaetes bacterium]|nr:ketoacyl-ACP synthase III [Spirochaetota bacterium]